MMNEERRLAIQAKMVNPIFRELTLLRPVTKPLPMIALTITSLNEMGIP